MMPSHGICSLWKTLHSWKWKRQKQNNNKSLSVIMKQFWSCELPEKSLDPVELCCLNKYIGLVHYFCHIKITRIISTVEVGQVPGEKWLALNSPPFSVTGDKRRWRECFMTGTQVILTPKPVLFLLKLLSSNRLVQMEGTPEFSNILFLCILSSLFWLRNASKHSDTSPSLWLISSLRPGVQKVWSLHLCSNRIWPI